MMLLAKYKGELYKYNHFPNQENQYEIYVENKALPDLENKIEECNYVTGEVEGYSFPIDISDERIEEVFCESIVFDLDTENELEKDIQGCVDFGDIIHGKYVKVFANKYIPGWTVLGKDESIIDYPIEKITNVKIQIEYYKKNGIVYGNEEPLVEYEDIDKEVIKEYLEKYHSDQF